MAEPLSQVVASMPRGRFLGLMALFLGPAVAIYTLFSIYPLIATMATGDLHDRQRGRVHVRRARQFRDALDRRRLVEAVLERGVEQSDLLRRPHGGSEPDRHRARGALEPVGPQAQVALSHRHLPADHAVGGDRRLLLEPHSLAPLGRGGERAESGGIGELVCAVARPALDRARHARADLGVAVRRHPDDADLCGAPQHSRGARRRRAGRRPWPVPHLLAHQAAAGAADHRPRLDPDLRRQLQRLRPHLFGQRARSPGRTSPPTSSAPSSTAPSSGSSSSSAIRPWARRSRR